MPSPAPYIGPRYQLALGKFRVLQVRKHFDRIEFSINLNETLLTIPAPPNADIREGDLLTLYTEVPLAKPS